MRRQPARAVLAMAAALAIHGPAGATPMPRNSPAECTLEEAAYYAAWLFGYDTLFRAGRTPLPLPFSGELPAAPTSSLLPPESSGPAAPAASRSGERSGKALFDAPQSAKESGASAPPGSGSPDDASAFEKLIR